MKKIKLTIASVWAAVLFFGASPSPAWQADPQAGATSRPDVLTPPAQRKAAPDFTLTRGQWTAAELVCLQGQSGPA